MRKNPDTGNHEGYYRLVESYRQSDGRVTHRTILNVGYLDSVPVEKLNQIQKLLSEKVKHCNDPLFKEVTVEDEIVKQYVSTLYARMIAEKRIDIYSEKKETKNSQTGKDLQRIDVNSIQNKEVREIGAEWLSYQALEQLQIQDFLEKQNWHREDIQLALTHIISRAVYPASELATSRWIVENSAVCELTNYPKEKITKDKLYGISKKLYSVKENLEQHLSTRTNELFDIQDKIILYDLTNTYFEGRKEKSNLAKYGRSKEKRSDAKLVVLALVINAEGFIKYSSIFEGNMSDSKTIPQIIDDLRKRTSVFSHKALVVLDAGIATDENLKLIQEKGYDYLCVSRSKLKNYTVKNGNQSIEVLDNKKQKIALTKVETDKNTDFYLKIESENKKLKERSMNKSFKKRFEEGMQKIKDSLTKKGGIKQEDKVHERIGRLKEKYPSISRHFEIKVEIKEEKKTTKTTKKSESKEVISRIATNLEWTVKEDVEINAQSGIYFLRTSLKENSEKSLWLFYNTIREIEASFRVLKTDLDLRPIYHKNDDSTMAHLHLGLLAYWVVNTVRYQLKNKQINSSWTEIVRTMNTQKAVTTVLENDKEDTIYLRQCSEPTAKVIQIYDALKYKQQPFKRKKYVVHKPELKKMMCKKISRLKPDSCNVG